MRDRWPQQSAAINIRAKWSAAKFFFWPSEKLFVIVSDAGSLKRIQRSTGPATRASAHN
jgi:hypothetical protein